MKSSLDPLKKGFFARFTLFLGVRKYFFFHPKCSKLCAAPLMDPKNPPILKKFKKNIFDPLFGPFKTVNFFARFMLFQGVRKYFFFIQNGANFAQPLLWILRTTLFFKNLKNYFYPLFEPFKNVTFFACFTLFQGVRKYFFSSKMEQTLHSPWDVQFRKKCMKTENVPHVIGNKHCPLKN